MRKQSEVVVLPDTAGEVAALRAQIRLLKTLLDEERAEKASLLNRLLGVEPGTAAAQPATPAWPALQPEDEAVEDVQSMLRDGSMDAREARAILDSLGLSDAEIDLNI